MTGWSLTEAVTDVIAERRRQVEVERFTLARDDAYSAGELGMVAACFAAGSRFIRTTLAGDYVWPSTWDVAWFRARNRRHALVKAAALIIAEIERLDRRGS